MALDLFLPSLYSFAGFSGGINITVTGQFIDSVAVPEMVIFVRQGSTVLKELRTVSNTLLTSIAASSTAHSSTEHLDHVTV